MSGEKEMTEPQGLVAAVRRENRHPASRLTDAIFDGAQWMRDEDPADPFAEPPPSYSQDNDLP